MAFPPLPWPPCWLPWLGAAPPLPLPLLPLLPQAALSMRVPAMAAPPNSRITAFFSIKVVS
jgi:hypothetical protein